MEIEFAKLRGKPQKPNQVVDIEEFIAVKGIKAQGNQLTSDKVKNIHVLDPLPFEEPKKQPPEEIEVVDEEDVIAPESAEKKGAETVEKKQDTVKKSKEDEGQTALF